MAASQSARSRSRGGTGQRSDWIERNNRSQALCYVILVGPPRQQQLQLVVHWMEKQTLERCVLLLLSDHAIWSLHLFRGDHFETRSRYVMLSLSSKPQTVVSTKNTSLFWSIIRGIHSREFSPQRDQPVTGLEFVSYQGGGGGGEDLISGQV